MWPQRIFVSSGAFPTRDLAEVLRLADRWGVSRIELSSGLAHRPDWPALLETARAGRRLLLHNYFPAPAVPFVLNLGSTDRATREASIAHAAMALRLSATCGAPFYSIHAGFAACPSVDELGQPWPAGRMAPREDSWQHFVQSTRTLVRQAESLGVALLIENNVLAPFNRRQDAPVPVLCCDPQETRALLAAAASPALGLLVDTGHLKVSAQTLDFDPWDFLDTLAPWIRAFHVSDNDGASDTNDAFGSDAWFLPALARWPDAPVVLEAYGLDEETLRATLSVLAAHTE